MRVACLLLLAGCSSGPAPTGSSNPGVIEVLSVVGQPGQVGQARAQFPDTFINDSGCVHPRVVGPCVIADCPDGMVASPEPHSDLGPIAISVNNQPLATLRFSGSDYAPATLTPPLWQAGDDVHISVGGDEAHIAAPAPITLTAPDFTQSIDLSQDLPLTWTGGSSGATVLLHIGAFATCELPSESGAGTIPAGALATVPATGSGIYGYTERPLPGQVGTTVLTFRPGTDLFGSNGKELSGSLMPK